MLQSRVCLAEHCELQRSVCVAEECVCCRAVCLLRKSVCAAKQCVCIQLSYEVLRNDVCMDLVRSLLL